MLADVRLLGLAAIMLAGPGCTRHSSNRPAAPTGSAVTVQVEPFATPVAAGSIVLPARVRAREEVTLTTRRGGRLTGLPFREGASVRRGDPVARFEAPEMRENLEAARAEYEAATLAAEVAVRQHARVESLYAARVVSSSERELAESADRDARSRLARARAEREALETASTLRAPFGGIVVRRHRDVGADLAAGEPVLDLRSYSGIEILLPVPEGLIPVLEAGPIAVERRDGSWSAARLSRLEGMTDFTSRTRTARLTPTEIAGLVPGDYSRVRLGGAAGAGETVAGVPASSIVRRGALTGVFLVDEGRARLRWIRLGRRHGDREEVLAGLFAGDSVVVAPEGLRDGAPVRITS